MGWIHINFIAIFTVSALTLISAESSNAKVSLICQILRYELADYQPNLA
jgi:hypothetical protein